MNYVLGFLTFVLASGTFGVLFCEISQHLTSAISAASIILGVAAGAAVSWFTRKTSWNFEKPDWTDWALAFLWFCFCYRFYGWVLFHRGPGVFTLAATNFGDLPWHITGIKSLTLSTHFWPDNPILTGEKFHYPFGIDMFNALFLKLGVPLETSMPVAGFLCAMALFPVFYLWGRGFAAGAFLFSGGIAGFAVIGSGILRDYQADLAWKNLAIALYLTQRGFLYAMPVGVLVLWAWRRRFLKNNPALPAWVEGLFWGTMPLYHVHTFIFLSMIYALWVPITRKWKDGLRVLSVAFVPATYEMIRLTDAFRRGSLLSLKPGWMIENQNVVMFFIKNYGPWVAAVLIALGLAIHKWRSRERENLLLIGPAAGIYFLCLFVMFAPWDWDNTKMMVWTYVMALPVVYDLTIKPLHKWLRVPVLVVLFFSGFVCVFGVYLGPGFEIYNRETVDRVCKAVADLPHDRRIAIAQTHNHPVMLCGHMAVAGYAGHLWSHGIPGHEIIEAKLKSLMMGEPDWQQKAKEIQARYLYWGPEEERQFPGSKKPWEQSKTIIAQGIWGRLYDLGEQP